MNQSEVLMNQSTLARAPRGVLMPTGLRDRCVSPMPWRTLRSAAAVHVGRLRALSALFAIMATVLVGTVLWIGPADAATCTESLQARLDAASSGDTVIAEPCIYREQIVIDKPLTLSGQPGSEIRGSDVWTRWRKRSGGLWNSTLSVPALPQDESNIFCMPNTTRCKLPEQVFFDGKPLTQVTSFPKRANQFFVNAKRRVVLLRDPRGHRVEVTTRQHWVLGTPSADDVTIEGWTMKHAGTEGRSAALMNRLEVHETGGERWSVRNNVLSDGNSAIISLTNAPSHEIVGNHILRGGMLGIKGAGRGSVIRSNEIAYNNTERYCYDGTCGIGATGGVKFASNVADTIFDQNVVHDNFGKGVHYDIGCSNNIASNNRIYDNARIGLNMELCYSGKMFGNVIYGNGYATPGGSRGTGILVHSSENTEIYDNVVANNQGGIAVIASGARPNHELTHDVFIHDNTIISQAGTIALAWRGSVDAFAPSANNLGADNRYYYPLAENGHARFAWDSDITQLSAFNATLGEERGAYLTTAEKDAILALWDISTAKRK
jgi:parallel beta-helix repeat protein